MGTAPYATGVAADAPDRLSQTTIHLTPSDRIVEPRRKNGGVKKFEDLRTLGAYSAINGPNQQERSLGSIRPGSHAYTLASEEASPDESHAEERIREA